MTSSFRSFRAPASIPVAALLMAGCSLFNASAAHAGNIVTTVATLGTQTDKLTWTSVVDSEPASTFSVFTTHSNTVTVSQTSGDSFFSSPNNQSFEGITESYNVGIGDALLLNDDTGSPGTFGPVTLTFSNPTTGFAAQIDSEYYGAFKGQIAVYHNATLLDTFTENGLSAPAGSGSAAIVLGALEAQPITSVVFTVPVQTGTGFNNSIVFDDLFFGNATSVPEPSTLAAFGLGVLALGGLMLRSRRRSVLA
jgi:hypothetical protein